jgi:hypothetical protein
MGVCGLFCFDFDVYLSLFARSKSLDSDFFFCRFWHFCEKMRLYFEFKGSQKFWDDQSIDKKRDQRKRRYFENFSEKIYLIIQAWPRSRPRPPIRWVARRSRATLLFCPRKIAGDIVADRREAAQRPQNRTSAPFP